MSTATRGRRAEHRVRDVLRRAGYHVIRAAGSKGPADLFAWTESDLLFVSVKTAGWPGAKDLDKLRGVPFPMRSEWLAVLWTKREEPRVKRIWREPDGAVVLRDSPDNEEWFRRWALPGLMTGPLGRIERCEWQARRRSCPPIPGPGEIPEKFPSKAR